MNTYNFSEKSNRKGKILTVLCMMIFFTTGNSLTFAQTGETIRPVLVTCKWLEDNISEPGLVILHIVTEEVIKESFSKFDIPEGARSVFYCGTGNSACINYVAAVIAGYRPVVYSGSMED